MNIRAWKVSSKKPVCFVFAWSSAPNFSWAPDCIPSNPIITAFFELIISLQNIYKHWRRLVVNCFCFTLCNLPCPALQNQILTLTPTNCSCNITHESKYTHDTFVANRATTSVVRRIFSEYIYMYTVIIHRRQNRLHRLIKRAANIIIWCS